MSRQDSVLACFVFVEPLSMLFKVFDQRMVFPLIHVLLNLLARDLQILSTHCSYFYTESLFFRHFRNFQIDGTNRLSAPCSHQSRASS